MNTFARPCDRARGTGVSRVALSCAAALCAAAGVSSVARADNFPDPIDIYTLGFLDNNHTPQTGSRFSSVTAMSSTGIVIGNQTRYEANSATSTGQTAWAFYPDPGAGLIRVGLFDTTNHVDNDNSTQISFARQVNDAGVVVGESLRYRFVTGQPPGSEWTGSGQSAWIAVNGVTSQPIGYTDPDHTTTLGDKSSSIVKLNAAGAVVGTSERFNGNTAWGRSSWVYSGGILTRIGLIDPEHTRDETDPTPDFQSSTVQFFNDNGDAVGTSNRYSGLTQRGQSAWLYSSGTTTTTNIGLTDTTHTNDNGTPLDPSDDTRISTIVALNNDPDGSAVVGRSNRYNAGGAAWGFSVWYRSGTTTQLIGLVDSDHTQGNGATGAKNSTVEELNDAGYARGTSLRYIGATQSGQSAWVYHADMGSAPPERVGLTDDEHTGANGLQASTASRMNLEGHVAGTSNRFTPADVAAGTSAWVHKNGSSDRIGFFDSDHTRGGFDINTDPIPEMQNSTVAGINDDGQVIGHSTRYILNQVPSSGTSAWISDGLTTTRIGLFDETRHQRDDDFQSSTAQFINNEGQVVGTSLRYESAETRGTSGWFYDDDLDQTFELVFSETSTGQASTTISFLSDTGIVLGFYSLFDENDDSLIGNRAFLWDFHDPLGDRFHDLGEVVDGGLNAAGWAALTGALTMSDLGHIRGQGIRTDGDTMPYLLTPIPEPAGLAALAMTAMAVLPRRRRRRSA